MNYKEFQCFKKKANQKSLDSPNYDNMTLDELIAASTSWVESLSSAQGRLFLFFSPYD